jgi:hypothetical protein
VIGTLILCIRMLDSEESILITPILDSGVLPTPRPRKRILGLIVGFDIGILFVSIVDKVGSAKSQSVLTLLNYFISVGLAVTIHEFGHLTAGWLVGFHFSHISVGPLSIKIQYGRLKVQIRRGLGALGYAGMHIETVKGVRRSLLLYTAAGPAANLISGVLAALLVNSAFPSLRTTWVAPFATGFSVLSLLIGLMSLVPYGKTVRSDGARIWMLLNSPDRTRRWITAAALASQQRRGVLPRNWKRTWLKAVCSVRDASVDEISGNVLAYIAASDVDDAPTAATHLERCLELAPLSPPASRDFVAREASYFCAWFRSDAKLAEHWLSQVKRSKLTVPLLQIRTNIALDCARHRFDDAIGGWQKGADFIERLPLTPIRGPLLESWREWGDQIRDRKRRQEVAGSSDTRLIGSGGCLLLNES